MIKLNFANALILFVITLLICAGSVAAQQGSIAITPASIDTQVKAGASYTQNFTLSNNTSERLRFRCFAADMWYDDQNQRINGRAGTLPRSASLWIQFTPSEVIVEPHTFAVVKATITVPQIATGSFYTTPVFEASQADKPWIGNVAAKGSSTASISVRFRVLMMLTTEQGAEYYVEIMDEKITPPTASSEMELSLDLSNRGTAHVKIRGAFAILDSTGKLVGRGAILEKRFLPTQRNIIKGKWSGDLSPGNYTCIVTLSYNRAGLEPTSLVRGISFTVK